MASDVLTEFVVFLRDGHLAIPEELRLRLGLEDGSPVRLSVTGNGILIEPSAAVGRPNSSSWMKELYDYFAPVREEVLASGITEEELNAEIDAAIEEVRAEHRARPR